MPRPSTVPYQWLPLDHWRNDRATRCRHEHTEVITRAATGAAARGEVRYWSACRNCGLEVGPFREAVDAARWPKVRRRRSPAD